MRFSLAETQGFSRTRQIWRLLAYGARYGHQSVESMRRMPITELTRFINEVGLIVKGENQSSKGNNEDGD